MTTLLSPQSTMPNPVPEMPGNPEPNEMPGTIDVPDAPSIEMPIDPGTFPYDPGQEPSSMPGIDVI